MFAYIETLIQTDPSGDLGCTRDPVNSVEIPTCCQHKGSLGRDGYQWSVSRSVTVAVCRQGRENLDGRSLSILT